MNNLIRAFIVVLILCSSASGALRFISDSGTLSEGSTVVFETEDAGVGDSTPMIWDNADSGTNNTLLNASPIVGNWTVVALSNTVYSNNDSHSGTQCFYTAPRAYVTPSNMSTGSVLETVEKFTWSFWFKFDYGGEAQAVTKIYQLWGNRLTGTDCDFAPGFFYSGAYSDWVAYNVTADNDCFDGREQVQITPFATEEVWHYIELVAERSTNGIADGTYIMTIDGVSQFSFPGNIMTRKNGQDWLSAKFFYGTLGTTGEYGSIRLDDVYFNDSWSVIKIGNAAKYADCTFFDVWPVNSWNPGSNNLITTTCNQGSFAGGATGYAYMEDANGNISDQDGGTPGNQGYSVTFATSTAPVVICQSNDTTTETSYAITATYTLEGARTVSTCTWSNSLGGSGSLTATGGNISGTITGLSVGDNVITITLTDSSAESGNCNTTITRTAATSYTAKAKKCTLKKATLK